MGNYSPAGAESQPNTRSLLEYCWYHIKCPTLTCSASTTCNKFTDKHLMTSQLQPPYPDSISLKIQPQSQQLEKKMCATIANAPNVHEINTNQLYNTPPLPKPPKHNHVPQNTHQRGPLTLPTEFPEVFL